jgi:hypothetical protein
VVGSDNVVQRKNVQKGALTADGRSIRSGLSAEDRVIVKGLQQSRVGGKVSITTPTNTVSTP